MILTERRLNQIIDDIQMLCLNADRIIITGSLALCVYGLKKEFNDVDIIVVNPSKECWGELLDKHRMDSPDNSYSLVSIDFGYYKMDIFRESLSQEHPVARIDMDGEIYLSTLDCIIKAKKSLGRNKDCSDFEMMQKELRDLIET